MTDRPKLYPGHQHQWAEDRFESTMVRCTVCHFRAPRNAAGLDGRMTGKPCNLGREEYGGDRYCSVHGGFAHLYGDSRCDKSAQPEQETRADD